MRVLVTFAVEAEFAPWRKRWPFVRVVSRMPHYSSGSWYKAKLGAAEVEVFLTGIALRKSEPGLTFLLKHSPAICISSGLAGALSPSLGKSEIVVARAVRAISGGLAQPCHTHLVEIAARMGAKTANLFLTSPRVVSTAKEKADAARAGDVVEMESLTILNKASETWIPCVAIRAISDSATEDLPLDFNQVTNSSGRISWSRVVLQLARKPSRVPRMLELARHSVEAANRLADFLDRYIPAVRTEKFNDELSKREQLSVR